MTSVVRMLRAQTQAELLRSWRTPVFSAVALVLPLLLYIFIEGGAHGSGSGVGVGAYFLASVAAYGLTNVMLFTFGNGIAMDRGRRMDVLMRATPLLPGVYLMSRLIVAVVFSLVAAILVSGVAAALGGVRLAGSTWLSLLVALLVGALPFATLGAAIAYVVRPATAPALITLLALTMSFASGMFVPLNQLPSVMQQIAPYLPTYHYVQLVWSTLGVVGTDPPLTGVVWLVGYAVVFAVVAAWAYSREAARRLS